MWVFAGGMFRSGSTLQFQIASHLVEHSGVGSRVSWCNANGFAAMKAAAGNQDGFLVCKAHKLSDDMHAEIKSGNGLVISVHRDVRDVIVSAMRKNDWSFKQIWKSGNIHKWIEQFEQWAAIPDALVSRYAELVDSPGNEAIRIGQLLGIDVPPQLSHQIDDEYSLERQRNRVESFRETFEAGAAANKFDETTLLHHNHIASGKNDEFITVLKSYEIAAIEDRFGDWLEKRGYTLQSPHLGILDRSRRSMLGNHDR